MVNDSKMEGGAQVLPARVRSTIQSIKEIVKNHSDADIYAALKESNMDPNETTQKLLNQDPFREVKRKRDRRNETAAQKHSIDQRKHSENSGHRLRSMTQPDHSVQREGYSRNPVINAAYGSKPLHGNTNGTVSKAFRVVRDNRVNSNMNVEMKTASLQCPPSHSDQIAPNISERGSTGRSTNQKLGWRGYSQVSNLPSSSSQDRQALGSITSDTSGKEVLDESTKSSRIQVVKPVSPHSHSTTFGSSNSVVGLYSSSTDPVHVPSPDSRASSVVGAIKREVGVVGVRRQASEDSLKHSSAPVVSSSEQMRREYSPSESFRSSAISKTDQPSQPAVTRSSGSMVSGSKSMLTSQHSGKPNQQVMGHQKGIKEWKPKSSQKSGVVSPGVIGTPPKIAAASDESSKDTDSEAAKLQDRLSQLNIHESQNVIIAQHIRVPDADRCQLTFGSFGMEYESSKNSVPGGVIEELNGESTAGTSSSDPILLKDNTSISKPVDSIDERVRNARSDSPASSASSENQLSEKKESNSQSLDSYSDIGLVREDTHSYAPSESHQQQDPSEALSFTAYDPQSGYDLPYFRTSVEEAVRGQSLQSPQEALSSHAANSIAASALPFEQQQQQQQHQHPHPVAAQMYPQVHVSHIANLMPYRQFLSPVYVPPMALPGYSSNPAYPPPHPSSGNSYMLMPGAATSHLSTGGLKYGIQQFKPVPAGSPTGFGNFAGPAGYAVNAPGVVGNATGMDDSSRIKYKDGNIYVSTPQAEASEIWIQNPREIPGLQSTPYYNMTGQAPHAAAYLPSHTSHASFNAAATQSSHMQFPGLYHPPPQPTPIASPHQLAPAMGGNVGVGVAAAGPVAQVGAYQQPQLGQFNWATNF